MTQTPPHTPALRFPEFRGAGAWEVKKLGEVCDLQDGYAFSPKNFTNSAIDAIQVIRITDINNKNKNADKVYVPTSLVKILKLDKYMVQKGDLLLSLTGAAGFNFFLWNSKPALINQRTMKIMAKEKLNTALLKLLEPLIHTEINSHGTGQNNNVSKETLKHTLSFLPKPDEQQRIADLLSSLDEVITAHSDRLDGLKDYKRGLMQQLFPAKGETTPTLRFPEFRGKDPWEEKRLVEVCSKIPQGGTPSTTKPDYWNGSINWLTPAEMGKTKDRFMHTTARKITELGLKKCSSDLLPINSIIVSTRAPIGYLIINKTEMAFNQGCKGLVPNKTTSYDFLYYTLSFYKNSLIDLGSGSTFKELTGNNLKNFKATFPSLEEQQKIADCLSAMDELITAQADKVRTLKIYKKGLMQQLFPKL